MEQRQLELLAKTLDDIRHQNGVECWYARELYPLLGYARWENFETAINRAKDSCRKTGASVADHFREVTKMVDVGSDAKRPVEDIKLTRYACYLVTLNGDPKKEAIAFAQAYFVTQTRTIELLQQRMAELERIDAREKLKITEREFSGMAFSRGVDGKGIGEIRAKGDEALFGGRTTDEMKQKLGIEPKKPLADYLPNVTLKAKDLATAMTIEKTRTNNLSGKNDIRNEHVSNNQNVRGALTKTGIYPESLPAGEDIKKIEARHRKETKALQKKQREELGQASKKLGTS
ncbi:DNA damage-inducible protein D [Candidatus Uhrbacteria bacterium]|nr:DNA damage-inducible protein D [Candidatus Uhrbacteria bacterium]